MQVKGKELRSCSSREKEGKGGEGNQKKTGKEIISEQYKPRGVGHPHRHRRMSMIPTPLGGAGRSRSIPGPMPREVCWGKLCEPDGPIAPVGNAVPLPVERPFELLLL